MAVRPALAHTLAADDGAVVRVSGTGLGRSCYPRGVGTEETSTRQRILDAALDLFGMRGLEAVSLDEIAREVGVRKQTVLYWFESKDELVAAVVTTAVEQLASVIEAALASAGFDPLTRIDTVVTAVFRPAVRRPALLGLIGEVERLPDHHAKRLQSLVEPYVERAVGELRAEMVAGRIRRADPALLLALIYATVTGIATEARVLEAVGARSGLAGLRRLRAELRSFLVAALTP